FDLLLPSAARNACGTMNAPAAAEADKNSRRSIDLLRGSRPDVSPNKKSSSACVRRAFYQLGPTGVEPARPCVHKALNLARLPTPPRARGFRSRGGEVAANMQVYRLDDGLSSCVNRRPFATGPRSRCLEWLACMKGAYSPI